MHRRHSIAALVVRFALMLLALPTIVASRRKKKEVAWDYYVGLWEGVDPVDGAQLQRSIVPDPAMEGAIIYAGRNEASQSCGCTEDGCSQVIGLVNPISGTVDPSDGTYTVSVDFTCFGSDAPLFSGVPVSLAPVTKDIIAETIAGYPDVIYLHRASPYYEKL